MRVGLAYDLKSSVIRQSSAPDDVLEEYDSPATIEYIRQAITASGHTPIDLGGGGDFLRNILNEPVDFVFNISEGRGVYRSREAQVPSVLEMLGIPYTGSDPLTLAISLDKPLTKKLAEQAGILTPEWLTFNDPSEIDRIGKKGFPFPAIAKPAFEGSSKGVRQTSLVEDPADAPQQIEYLLHSYQQPVMLEQFIDGDEITVGILGNKPPKVIGMMRILPQQPTNNFVYSLEVKRDWVNLVKYEAPAKINGPLQQKIATMSLQTYQILGCRDFARVDFRVSREGVPYLLEINPLPGLGDYSDLIIMAQQLGWTHQGLISAVLETALARNRSCLSE